MSGPTEKIRVLLADDHRMMRDALKSVLKDHFEIVAEAEDGESALALAKQTRPHVVLLDIGMPGTAVSPPPIESRARCPRRGCSSSANTTTRSTCSKHSTKPAPRDTC